MSRYVGIDLGGTHIRAAVATGPATHEERIEHPTPHAAPPDELVAACVAAALEANGGAAPDGIAIGFPGPLNPQTGLVYAAPNLGPWENTNALDLFREHVSCPVAIQNDAKLAGFAEWLAGAGQNTKNLMFITVSTGIGCAFIVHSELYTGSRGIAGEIGHLYVGDRGSSCGLGHTWCLEAVASGTSIGRIARAQIAKGEASTLSALAAADINAAAVESAAHAGDPVALRIFNEAAELMGRAVGGVLNLMNPEMVVMGGGVVSAGDLYLTPFEKGVAAVAFDAALEQCAIVPAGLGTDAGLVGACAWAMRRFAG